MKNRSRGSGRDFRGPRIEKITTSDVWDSFFLGALATTGVEGDGHRRGGTGHVLEAEEDGGPRDIGQGDDFEVGSRYADGSCPEAHDPGVLLDDVESGDARGHETVVDSAQDELEVSELEEGRGGRGEGQPPRPRRERCTR